MKNIFIAFLVLVVGFAFASAAEDEVMTGTIVAIEGNLVKIEVAGKIPAWARKGGYLRAVSSSGELLLRGAKITVVDGNVISATSVKAKELKTGTVLTLGKGKPSAGC